MKQFVMFNLLNWFSEAQIQWYLGIKRHNLVEYPGMYILSYFQALALLYFQDVLSDIGPKESADFLRLVHYFYRIEIGSVH